VQQPKQSSPLLLQQQQQQQLFSHSAASNTPLPQLGQSSSETSLLPQPTMTEYRQHNPDGVAVCSVVSSSRLKVAFQ